MVDDLLAAPIWTRAVDWFFVARAAPSLLEGLVTVRCGQSILSLDPQDGTGRWACTLDPPAGNETFLLATDRAWITDIHRQPDRLTTLVAIGLDGAQRWRVDLPVIGSSHGAILLGGRLVLPAKQPRAGQRLLTIDEDGGGLTNVGVERGITFVVAGVGERVVAADAMAREDRCGLYSMGLDGRDVVDWAEGAAVALDATSDVVTAVIRSAAGLRAVAFDRADGARRWEAPVSAPAIGVARDVVVLIEDGHPTCRSIIDGAFRWRASARAYRVTQLATAGALAFIGHDRGRDVLALADGTDVGTLRSGYGAVACTDHAMYLAGTRSVVGLALPETR